MNIRTWLLAGLCWAPMVAAEIIVSDVWARETVPGTNTSALFATLENTTRKPTRLVSVSVEGVDKAELHAHTEEGGMMRMRRVEAVEVGGRAEVKLAPGGFHVMLFQLAKPLKAGNEVPVVFQFANGEKVSARARVVNPKQAMQHHNH
ncbi:copper chaperone PCu(A)C [Simiduia sp. 21SJ11W-1]|uniref:copper chaperone PCu(A)C n=1 Tax=Simiduia sp. 21SJ11W-1 TaxID=2909669 RepID=UPI0020A15C5B|nr:copper chaperone PCu(A)C [Simiduia sp. 21SJ11W-1]UTA47585.1 copper chaperone PCu(A)C [Simiduia sp. 21SJ11W-1]